MFTNAFVFTMLVLASSFPSGRMGMEHHTSQPIKKTSGAPDMVTKKVLLEETFDDRTIVDNTKWSFMLGDGSQYGNPGWGNGEKQFYVDNPQVTEVRNGNLRINVLPGSVVGRPDLKYVSGKLVTKTKFFFTYGRVEARIRLGAAMPGLFPAFWMCPQDWAYGGWPKSGEVDIFEYISNGQSHKVPQSLHFQDRHGGNPVSFSTGVSDPTKFNVYAVDWQENEITFYVNGQKTGSYPRPDNATPDQWPYDKAFYLLLNVAVEPNFSSAALPDDFQGDAYMEVDWIRITQ